MALNNYNYLLINWSMSLLPLSNNYVVDSVVININNHDYCNSQETYYIPNMKIANGNMMKGNQ